MSPVFAVLGLGNGLLGFFLFAAVYVAGFIIVAAFLQDDRKKAERRIGRFAADLNGELVPSREGLLPSIGFRVRGGSALMSFASDRRSRTILEVRVPSHTQGRLTLEAVGMSLVAAPACRGVGDTSFDANFVVRSSPRSFASRMFSAGRRTRFVEAIRRLSPLLGLRLGLEPGRLEIRVAEELVEWPQVLRMKLAAEEIVDLLLSVPLPGIELGERVERASGLCPICTTPLRDPIVRCRRCSSPHHQDCWEYLGHCATYGCDLEGRRRSAA